MYKYLNMFTYVNMQIYNHFDVLYRLKGFLPSTFPFTYKL